MHKSLFWIFLWLKDKTDFSSSLFGDTISLYAVNVSMRLWAPSSVAIPENWHSLKKKTAHSPQWLNNYMKITPQIALLNAFYANICTFKSVYSINRAPLHLCPIEIDHYPLLHNYDIWGETVGINCNTKWWRWREQNAKLVDERTFCKEWICNRKVVMLNRACEKLSSGMYIDIRVLQWSQWVSR